MIKLRILALLPFLVKGALSIEIFRALRARGIEITVAYCSNASANLTPDLMQDFQDTGDLIDLSGVFSNAKRLELIANAIADREISVILQVGATELYHLLPYWKEKFPEIRVADILYNEIGHTLNHFLFEACIDIVFVESDYMRLFVERASGKDKCLVEVLHSGVDLNVFSPIDKRVGSQLKVGYVGRMSAEKNPLGFIDLVERLGPANQTLKFEMFGTGPDADVVQARIAKSSMASRLTYHGFVSHARDALHQLDVLILPSKLDGRPVTIMEANACGVPVIAAPVGGVPELVVDGVNGFLISPTETERINVLLSRFLQQPQSLQTLRNSARAYALEHFDYSRMIGAYAAALGNLCAASAVV